MVVVIQKADIKYVEICTNRCKEWGIGVLLHLHTHTMGEILG